MIYLDYNATTPIDKNVSEEMKPYIDEYFGNPSSGHALGKKSKEAIQIARKRVAGLIGSKPEEIVFTSGGSESNNMVLKGVSFSLKNKGNHIITSGIEHPAIINPCKYLEQNGYHITYVPVDKFGMVNPEDVKKSINSKTILITIMHANNEVGTLQPIEEIGVIAQEHGILFHTDAAQSVGKILTKVTDLNVDFLSIAGHKLYAPKGVGALYIRAGISIEPLIHGAGQEFGKRAGTENVIYNVALGKASEIAQAYIESSPITTMTELRDYFHNKLIEYFGDIVFLNGHPEKRLPNTLNVSFKGYIGSEVLNKNPEIAASTGSACHEGKNLVSPVLKAMDTAEEIAMGTIRFSMGRFTSKKDIEECVELLRTNIKNGSKH